MTHLPRPVVLACALLGVLTPAVFAAPPGHGLDLTAMDISVKPCDDFYQYANGKWLARTAIPAEYPDWNSFGIVYEHSLAAERALADRAADDKSAAPNSPEGKVGSFYRAASDEARIQADGITPLAPEFARIGAVQDVPGLLTEFGHLHRIGIGAGWNFGVGQDNKDSTQEIAQLGQGGFSLPERGYYERTDKDTQATRAAFVAHVAKTFALLGETPDKAAADAQTVMAIETRLALASKTPTDLRDPQANYHKMTLADLDGSTPGVEWRPYFSALGLPDPGGMDVGQPAFFVEVGRMLTTLPLADWKTYTRWQLIDTASGRLSKAFDSEHFAFYGTALSGIKQQQPRWKRALGATDGAVGEALGQLYVAQNFPPPAKARALALVQNLKSVLRDDLAGLPWMGPDTRRQALGKVDAMAIKIGYPDKWRDYSRLDVSSPSYVVNALRADEFEFQRSLNKIGKPVDKTEWGMTPPTVNAYYSPSMNDINFPAGILQPPFFNPDADDAVNYGAIGAVIGHEMTHGFDDQGRQYDAQGNLHDWWTADDLRNFTQRAQGIIAQYSAYEPLPGQHINGALTTGENIADIGGLKIAYLALEKSLKGKPRTKIDGYTPEQRFFLSFAQVWHDKRRPAYAKVALATDPHSPDKYRVIGALADTPEFRQAFGCPPDPKASPTHLW